ncbi:metal-dependent hydrolase [Shewanella algicola]|nr:metal-dependent hydrolase [Shewanella algicola]
MFRNHLLVTTAVAICVVKHMDFALPLWVLVTSIYFGSILPDLDHPGSTIGKRLLFISIPLGGLFGHRQITHSIWPFVITLWIMSGDMGSIPVMFACMIGYASHLIADFVSDGGVPLFWPSQKRVGIKLCSSGGVVEPLIAISMLVLAIIF